MSIFLSQHEKDSLQRLKSTLPEGLKISNVAYESLIKRNFAVRSDGGYVYCTANGLKYLQDQIPYLENKIYFRDLAPTLFQSILRRILMRFGFFLT